MTPGICGPSSHDAFAFYDPDSSSLRTSQDTLLSDSTWCSPTLPRWGCMFGGALFEQRTPGRLIGESDSSSLLPTPNGFESTPTDEFVEEMRAAGVQGDERLYLPGRKWHSQRTLSRIAPALLPTPGANDSTGAESTTRQARQETGQTGGPSLRDLTHLLPTPKGASARASRHAMVEIDQWSAPSLEQAIEISQGILPREFHSWAEVPGWSGERTAPPSSAGSASSDEKHHGQLTIEDA